MKKLLFVSIALFILLLTTGCGAKQNTVRFNGEDGSSEKESAEVSEEATNDGETDETTGEAEKIAVEDLAPSADTPSGKLSVTSFDGAFLKTTYSFNVVKGDAPTGTKKITVNDYKLSKFIGGQTKWDYIASTRYGTLKDGLNTYVVKAYDANGDEIDSMIFSINYEALTAAATLPNVGANLWLTLLATFMLSGIYSVLRKYRWL